MTHKTEVPTDVMRMTGSAIIRAIFAGERDSTVLASARMCKGAEGGFRAPDAPYILAARRRALFQFPPDRQGIGVTLLKLR